MTTNNDRIKNCIVCGKQFEDNTRPKNKKTCSKKCGDEARKARQRKNYRKENPPKPNQRDLYYYSHYEYSFWVECEIGHNQMWKEAVPYSPEKLESIASAREVYEIIGGKKRGAVIDYNGDEGGYQKINVQFVESDRKPSDVITYQLTPEELEEYLAKKAQKV